MWPLIVSGGLCSWLQIDSNWTDSSNIKDIKHPVMCVWSDLTGQRKTFRALDTRWQDLLLLTLPNHPPILLEMTHPYMFPKRTGSFISLDPSHPPNPPPPLKNTFTVQPYVEWVFFGVFFLQADWFICRTLWLWCMDVYWFWLNYIHPHFIHDANLVQAPFFFPFFWAASHVHVCFFIGSDD